MSFEKSCHVYYKCVITSTILKMPFIYSRLGVVSLRNSVSFHWMRFPYKEIEINPYWLQVTYYPMKLRVENNRLGHAGKFEYFAIEPPVASYEAC